MGEEGEEGMDPVHVSESVDIVSMDIAGAIGFDESLCEMICCNSELFVEVAIAVLLGMFKESSIGDKCRSWLLDVSGVVSMERGVVSREIGVFEVMDSVVGVSEDGIIVIVSVGVTVGVSVGMTGEWGDVGNEADVLEWSGGLNNLLRKYNSLEKLIAI